MPNTGHKTQLGWVLRIVSCCCLCVHSLLLVCCVFVIPCIIKGKAMKTGGRRWSDQYFIILKQQNNITFVFWFRCHCQIFKVIKCLDLDKLGLWKTEFTIDANSSIIMHLYCMYNGVVFFCNQIHQCFKLVSVNSVSVYNGGCILCRDQVWLLAANNRLSWLMYISIRTYIHKQTGSCTLLSTKLLNP